MGGDGWVVGSHLDDAAGERLDQHVLRLEVAVDQVERMDVRQRSKALVRNRADARQSEVGRPVGPRNVLVQLVQVVAQQLAHDEEVLLVVGAVIVSSHSESPLLSTVIVRVAIPSTVILSVSRGALLVVEVVVDVQYVVLVLRVVVLDVLQQLDLVQALVRVSGQGQG